MKYILDFKNDNYYLVTIKEQNGVKSRLSTNYQDEIVKTIMGISQNANMLIEVGNDMRLYYHNKELVLTNWRIHANDDLYNHILRTITKETKCLSNYNRYAIRRLLLTTGITLVVAVTSPLIGRAVAPARSIEVQRSYDGPLTNEIPMDILSNNDIYIQPVDEKVSLVEKEEPIDYHETSEVFPLATNMNTYAQNKLHDFYYQDAWKYIEKYSALYGVDKNLLVAIAFAESSLDHDNLLPSGSRYNGHAVGMFQHEHPDREHDVVAFNYMTNQYDTERMCMDNACNLETNIKMGAMLLQNRLYKYHNNIYLTIQSYNYGENAVNIILDKYANENNKTVSEVIDNYKDTGWLEYVTDFHNNPNKYINWKYSTYGNDKYIANVLGFYVGKECVNKNEQGEDISIDLETLEINKALIR